MRAKLLGAVLAALFAPLALAADIDRAGKVAAPTVARADEPAWNRTGAYVGAVGAYDISILQAEGFDLANGKLMAGALIGYNWRVAGFVFGQLGRAAETGDEVFYDGLRFTVVEVDGARIERLEVEFLTPDQAEQAQAAP